MEAQRKLELMSKWLQALLPQTYHGWHDADSHPHGVPIVRKEYLRSAAPTFDVYTKQDQELDRWPTLGVVWYSEKMVLYNEKDEELAEISYSDAEITYG
jgi:hypothetical protein